MMLDVDRYLGPLEPPQYARFADVLTEALPALRPPRRITVPAWAEAERTLRTPTYSGPWRNDDAPYLVEPSLMTTSRKYTAVVFVGPARTVKTDALILNTFGQRVCAMPRDMLIVAPSQNMAREFSITKLDKMIDSTPAVLERIDRRRGGDNIYDKKFKGGMRLRIGWPVIGQLSMVDIPDALLTDYDRFDDDIDGEGSPFDLARKRNQTFGSLGMTIAESSPGRPIEADEEWKPSTPHEAPPASGILGIYNSGTRAQFYWTCPHCKTPFRPTFERLHWEERQTNGESAKSVFLACPSGCVIAPDEKPALNRAGIWLHETSGGELVEIGDRKIRDTDIASYWCEGPIAALQSWPQLVLRYLDAVDHFRATGDETRLKATITLDQGRPYRAKVQSIGEAIAPETLKALAKSYPLKTCPPQTRFLTCAVDVQPNRFVVAVDAWCADLERYLVDRFDIALPPAGAPGAAGADGEPLRAIDPPRYAEDWAALDALAEKAYPVSGSTFSIRPRAIAIDSHGAEGTTANAYAFWRAKKKAGQHKRFFLLRGVGGIDKQRAIYKQVEKRAGPKGRARRSDIFLIEVGTDPLKDEIALSLTRKDDGPNAYHLPEALPENILKEFAAEVRTKKGWQKKKPGARNESLDLAVYSKALAIVLKAENLDWQSPPAWAAPVESNSFALMADSMPAKPAPASPPSAPKRRGRWIERRGGGSWI